MKRGVLISCLLIGFIAAPVAMANAQNLRFETDPSAPIDVRADHVDWYGVQRRAEFSGRTLFQQGPMQMSAQRMQLMMNETGSTERLTALEDVLLVSKNPEGQPVRQATADMALYQPKTEILLLRGNVQIVEAGERSGSLRGEMLQIDMKSGRAILQGGGQGGGKGRARIELR